MNFWQRNTDKAKHSYMHTVAAESEQMLMQAPKCGKLFTMPPAPPLRVSQPHIHPGKQGGA